MKDYDYDDHQRLIRFSISGPGMVICCQTALTHGRFSRRCAADGRVHQLYGQNFDRLTVWQDGKKVDFTLEATVFPARWCKN